MSGEIVKVKLKLPKHKAILALTIIAAVFFVLVCTLTAWAVGNRPLVKIPNNIESELNSPLILPKKMPGSFKIDPKTISYSNNTLFFYADDLTGQTIIFSQQPKPSKDKIEQFHTKDLSQSKNLNNVPFASVFGKIRDQITVLSVVTDKTWLLVSSDSASISQEDMTIIAQNLRQK